MRGCADVCHARNEAVGTASACGLTRGGTGQADGLHPMSTRAQPVPPCRPRAVASYVGRHARIRDAVGPGHREPRRQRGPAGRHRPGLRPDRRRRQRHAGRAGTRHAGPARRDHRGHPRPVQRGVDRLAGVREHRAAAHAQPRQPGRDGRGGRRAGRRDAGQPGHRRRLRGGLQRWRAHEYRRLAGHHGRDRGRVRDRGAAHQRADRGRAGLPVRVRRAMERGHDPPRVPGPGRTSRAHPGRDPARPGSRDARGRAGRAGQDRPRHPRRAGPLAGRGLGQPPGRRRPAHGGITPRGQPRAGQGDRVRRAGRHADPGGPGPGPPGHPGPARPSARPPPPRRAARRRPTTTSRHASPRCSA
jgi:hypothetical protein